MHRGYTGYRHGFSMPKQYPVMEKYPEDIECVYPSADPKKGSIYVSNVEAAQNFQTLQKLNIKAVMTCAKGYDRNIPKSRLDMFQYFPLEDKQSCMILPYIEKGCNFIAKACEHTNVLVHCIAGVSRSVSMVIAYLIRDKGMTYEDAYRAVKSRRKIISPNQGFIHQLKEYARTVKTRLKQNMNTDNYLKQSGNNQRMYSSGIYQHHRPIQQKSSQVSYTPYRNTHTDQHQRLHNTSVKLSSNYAQRNNSHYLKSTHSNHNSNNEQDNNLSNSHLYTQGYHVEMVKKESQPEKSGSMDKKEYQHMYSSQLLAKNYSEVLPRYKYTENANRVNLGRYNNSKKEDNKVQLPYSIKKSPNSIQQHQQQHQPEPEPQIPKKDKSQPKSIHQTPQKILPSRTLPQPYQSRTAEPMSTSTALYNRNQSSPYRGSHQINQNSYAERSVQYQKMNDDLNEKINAIHEKYEREREALMARRVTPASVGKYNAYRNENLNDNDNINDTHPYPTKQSQTHNEMHRYRYGLANPRPSTPNDPPSPSPLYQRYKNEREKYNQSYTLDPKDRLAEPSSSNRFGGYLKESRKYADMYENKYGRGLRYNDVRGNNTFYGGRYY